MNESLWGMTLVVACSVIEGCSQVCLKKSAMVMVGKFSWIMVAIVFFMCEAVLYTIALQTLDVSIAYTIGALSFISVTLFSRWLLKESVDARRWIGLGLILIGCVLVVTQR